MSGATCPDCGEANSIRIEVTDEEGNIVRVYFECQNCGNVW